MKQGLKLQLNPLPSGIFIFILPFHVLTHLPAIYLLSSCTMLDSKEARELGSCPNGIFILVMEVDIKQLPC